MHKLWELGLLERGKNMPKPVRKLARRVLMRRGDRYQEMLAESLEPVPASVVATLSGGRWRLHSRRGLAGAHMGVLKAGWRAAASIVA